MRYKIEIMFGQPADWRRIPTRYRYRRAHAFPSATTIAATAIFWLSQLTLIPKLMLFLSINDAIYQGNLATNRVLP